MPHIIPLIANKHNINTNKHHCNHHFPQQSLLSQWLPLWLTYSTYSNFQICVFFRTGLEQTLASINDNVFPKLFTISTQTYYVSN